MAVNDITGQKFGRLVAMSVSGTSNCGYKIWRCLCDCGEKVDVLGSSLRSGHTASCGCYRSDELKKSKTTHGYSRHPMYSSWNTMIQRCHSPNYKNYPNYGGRGITVCDKWRTFAGFIEDMGERPTGMTLERIDNDLGYCKDNCKWATMLEQSANKRNNKILTIDGVSNHLNEWARISGLKRSTLSMRVYVQMWPMDSNLLKPARPKSKKVV